MWFQFSQRARSQVHFALHDILDTPLHDGFKIISLLKVLPHYPRESRLAILANIHASLVEGGWLLVDSEYAAEDPAHDNGPDDSSVGEELCISGFNRMPAYAPAWWGEPEDLTNKVMLWRRQ